MILQQIKIVTIQWIKDWCEWKINVFHSISADFIFAQTPPWNCYNFPGMAGIPMWKKWGVANIAVGSLWGRGKVKSSHANEICKWRSCYLAAEQIRISRRELTASRGLAAKLSQANRHVWEDGPSSNKGTKGIPTSRPPSNIVCLMAVTRYVCNVCWVMLIV